MRARAAGAAFAAAVLLTGCAAEYDPAYNAARRVAAREARERHAVAGAAVMLVVVMLFRLAGGRGDRPRERGPHPVRLPTILASAALASEVTGMLLLAYAGGALGYALVPAFGGEGGDLSFRVLGWIFVGGPLLGAGLTVAVQLLRLPRRLPWVSTTTFVMAALAHALTFLIGAGIVLNPNASFDGWRVVAATLAATGVLGLLGYAAAVGARSVKPPLR